MKVLLLHNRYQLPGGEDTAVLQEYEMLKAAGIMVELMETDNDNINSIASKIKVAMQLPYSVSARRKVEKQIKMFGPDVVHVHNFFPNMTPSVYDACYDANVPVVQTLHNFRLICANAFFFREGSMCTQCLHRSFPFPAVLHSCYRGSRIGSAAVAAMISIHHHRQTWSRRVSRFIALTEFAREIFISGIPISPSKVVVKPNAVADFGQGNGEGGFALYVGRLSEEKGIRFLVEAARIGDLGMPLTVAGGGPLQYMIERAHNDGILNYVGQQSPAMVRQLMRRAKVLIVPSMWYEGLPMVVPEAFSAGLPIIASRIGALESLVSNNENGILVSPGSSMDIVQAIGRIAADDSYSLLLRRGARETYELKYSINMNVQLLLKVYEDVIGSGPNKS